MHCLVGLGHWDAAVTLAVKQAGTVRAADGQPTKTALAKV